MLRLIAELNKDHLSGALYWFADVNFLYFAVMLLGVCVVLLVGVSLFYAEPRFEQIRGLTYATTVVEDREASRASWSTRDVVLSAVVLVLLAMILIYFSPLGVG
jgi:SSS family solute:Na+ symporter